jgi:hypothetical protein
MAVKTPPKKKKGIQKIGRVAGVQAAMMLLEKPYKATQLAEALGMHIRITYRIIDDLRATGHLYSHRCYYWFDPKKNNDLQHMIPLKDPYA